MLDKNKNDDEYLLGFLCIFIILICIFSINKLINSKKIQDKYTAPGCIFNYTIGSKKC